METIATPATPAAQSAVERRIMAVAVTVNALSVMNFTTIGVALPRIAAAVGLPSAEELWLPDTYLIAVVCVTPLCSYLLTRLGQRLLLMACVAGMLATSLAMPLATSALVLIGLGFLQGAFVAPMAPATQTLVVAGFPGERRGIGMAVWGAGTMAGVLIGALAGGWIAETSWRAALLLCVPFGVVALATVIWAAPRAEGASIETDWLGLVLLVAGMIALGVVLNLGEELHWFRSPIIVVTTALCASVLAVFAWRYPRVARPIVSLQPLRERRFAFALVLIFGITIFSTGQFETDLLGGPLGFDPEMLGVRSALGGVFLITGILLAGRIAQSGASGARLALALVVIVGGKIGFTFYEPGIDRWEAIWPQMVTGLGIGVLTTLLAVLAFERQSGDRAADAASLYGLAGQLAWALGLALLGVVQAVHEDRLVATGMAEQTAALWSLRAVVWLELAGTAALVPIALLLDRRRRALVTPGRAVAT